MRSLKDNQSLTPVLVNSDYPNGAIINETSSQPGTAVVGQIYNDVLVNVFKIIELVLGGTNGIADNETTSYQLLAALQKLPNIQNDIEQVLTLASTTFTLSMDITKSPNKYFVFAKAVGTYNPATTYTFKGTTGSPSYSFTSPTGFNSGDELLVIIDQAGVKAYSFGGGTPASGHLTFTAGDLLGSDPFFYLPLTGSIMPVIPKYLTMYITNGDGDSQQKMIAPAYVATTRVIFGMSSPTDWPDQIIDLYFI
jgi:hypothetical protein